MAKIVKEDHKLVREDVAREEALKQIRQDDQPYKEELVEDLESDTMSFTHRESSQTYVETTPSENRNAQGLQASERGRSLLAW